MNSFYQPLLLLFTTNTLLILSGTTRDIVEISLDLGGYPVIISDTAGLRQTDDIIEIEGVRRARARAQQADVAVVILEAQEILPLVRAENFEWRTFLNRYLSDIGIYELDNLDGKNSCAEGETLNWIEKGNYVTLINKMDLIKCEHDRDLLENTLKDHCVLLSLKTLHGLDNSLSRLKEICASLCQTGTAENPTLTAARHRTHISSCLKNLKTVVGLDSNTEVNENLQCPFTDLKTSFKSETGNHSSQAPLTTMPNVLAESNFVNNTPYSPVLNTTCSASEKGSSDTGTRSEFFSKDVSEDTEVVNLLHREETIVIAAHYIQQAATSLGHVTGRITTEDVLDHIFSAFCIGK